MKSLRMVALVLTALLSLAACSAGSPQTAAAVGSTTISVSKLDQSAADVARVLGRPAVELRPSVLAALVQNEIAQQYARQHDLKLDSSQRAAFIASSAGLQALASDPATSDFVNGVADAQQVLTAIGSVDGFRAYASSLRPWVNPRYGVWDLANLGPAGSGSLSQPFATTAPAETTR